MVKSVQVSKKVQINAGAVKKGSRRTWVLFSLAIVFLTIILYANTLQNGYALDDKGIITQNKFTLKGFAGIPDLLTTSYWEGINKNVRSYRPLAPVSFAIEVGLWGLNPAAGHLSNLVIYLLTGLVLLFFLKRVFEKIDPGVPPVIPFIITMLFLAHPIHTEVVANIKSRDAMFELLFILLSGYFLLRFIAAKKRSDLILSVLSYFPALLSKESAITYIVMVPVILVLMDDSPMKKKAQTTLLYLIPVAVFLVLFFKFSNIQEFQKLHIMDNALVADAPAGQIWATKFLILGKYLALLIFPHPLVYDYSFNQIPLTDFSNPAVFLSLIIYVSAASFLIVILFKRLAGKKVTPGSLVAAFSAAWFFMGFFASSNLLMLIGSTMGERFMYAPSAGLLMILVYGGYRLACRASGNKSFKGLAAALAYFCFTVIIAGYILKTIDRNKAWKDDFTLFSTDIRYLGENTKANDFLGNLYRKNGDSATDPALKTAYYTKAIEYKEKAVSIYPRVPEIHQQLGFLYGSIGAFEKAITAYKTAIEMNPGEITNYIQVGKAYGTIHKIPEGLEYLEKAERIDPDNADLLRTLGIIYAQSGQTGKAIMYFEKALARDPSNQQISGYLAYAKKQAAMHK